MKAPLSVWCGWLCSEVTFLEERIAGSAMLCYQLEGLSSPRIGQIGFAQQGFGGWGLQLEIESCLVVTDGGLSGWMSVVVVGEDFDGS